MTYMCEPIPFLLRQLEFVPLPCACEDSFIIGMSSALLHCFSTCREQWKHQLLLTSIWKHEQI